MVELTLSYSGQETERRLIDFYDVSQALVGFQRSLALTTHLVLNDEVITQAPALKGATILAEIPGEGSWKFTCLVMVGIYTLGTAPRDTPIGHLISSAYDYVISESLGFHVDYDKSLGEQYEDLKGHDQIKRLSPHRFDSVIEKCETAVKDMHRPIVMSETATSARITSEIRGVERPFKHPLTPQTYEYISFTEESNKPQLFEGRISSYNINTYKGRIYSIKHRRPIPFEIAASARTSSNIRKITRSLTINAESRADGPGEVTLEAYTYESKSGQVKRLYVVDVQDGLSH